jgi:hypothetical protein
LQFIAPLTLAFYLKSLPALFSANDEKNHFLKWICGSDNHDFPNPVFTVFTTGMKTFQGWLRGTKLVVFAVPNSALQGTNLCKWIRSVQIMVFMKDQKITSRHQNTIIILENLKCLYTGGI